MTSRWAQHVEERNAVARRSGRTRSLRPLSGRGPRFTEADGTGVVSFASNDYLGLSQHPVVRAAAIRAIEESGTGSGSARLIVGDRPVHHELEAAIAEWKQTDAALLFSTGFMANLGVLSALAVAGTLIVSDELNHASIIDGTRLARGTVRVSRHLDVDHVDALLSAHDGPAVVVSDTVFSMDGDTADLEGLGEVCAGRGALLVLDDAHAVLGPTWCPPSGLDLVRVGTLSKTLGSLGGFVAASRPVIDLLVNGARSFIFTTGPTPADTAAALAALSILRSAEGNELTTRLRSHVDRILTGHPSPIVPVIIGSESDAMAAAHHLLVDHGLVVPAIRPPTVAEGTCRLRITVSSAHTADEVDRLAKALADL